MIIFSLAIPDDTPDSVLEYLRSNQMSTTVYLDLMGIKIIPSEKKQEQEIIDETH